MAGHNRLDAKMRRDTKGGTGMGFYRGRWMTLWPPASFSSFSAPRNHSIPTESFPKLLRTLCRPAGRAGWTRGTFLAAQPHAPPIRLWPLCRCQPEETSCPKAAAELLEVLVLLSWAWTSCLRHPSGTAQHCIVGLDPVKQLSPAAVLQEDELATAPLSAAVTKIGLICLSRVTTNLSWHREALQAVPLSSVSGLCLRSICFKAKAKI